MITTAENCIKIINVSAYALFRTGLKISLGKKEGIEIIGEAENGQQLLQILEHVHPDVITMDISMPVMNGMEALPIIKKRYPAIKVIILTMHNDRSMIIKIMELGANAYLTLENDSDAIYEVIKKCYSNGFYVANLLRENLLVNPPDSPKGFNEKEIKILKLLCEKKSTSEIAKEVDLSPRTVEAIFSKFKTKTGAQSVEQLIEFSKKNNLLE